MAKPCSVCVSPHREAIDKLLVSGVVYREITGKFSVSKSALERHKSQHLPETLRAAQELMEAERGISVAIELKTIFDRVKLLCNAVDAWLEDPAHPGAYDISPRPHEITVIYLAPGESESGKPVRRRAALSTLLRQVAQESPELQVLLAESHTSDPRELLLKTAQVYKDLLGMFIQIGDIADLQDRIFELERRLTDGHRIS